MKHVAAYLLLVSGGNASPSAKDVTDLLATVGIEADTERLEKVVAELSGKDVAEVRFSSVMTEAHYSPVMCS